MGEEMDFDGANDLVAVEPRYGSALWGGRLQALWIIFAAFYLAVADQAPRILISSIMILAAGVFLLAIFAHILASGDLERTRRMLLVTMTANLFVIGTAFHSFNDHMAAGFAALFAIMVAGLLWFAEAGPAFKRLQYLCFSSMMFALACACVGLPTTLLIQSLITHRVMAASAFVFAPLGTVALAGLCVGLLVEGRVLSTKLFGYADLPPDGRKTTIAKGLYLSIAVGIVENSVNSGHLVSLIPNDCERVALSIAYLAAFIVPAGCLLSNASFQTRMVRARWAALFSVAAGGTWGIFIHVLVGITPKRQDLVFHAGVGLSLGIGLIIGSWIIGKLSETLLAARFAPANG